MSTRVTSIRVNYTSSPFICTTDIICCHVGYKNTSAETFTGTGKALKKSLFNQWIIAKGYAYEATYARPYKYQKEFRAAQKQAEKDKWGFWDPHECK